jgi:hypothetical protein
MDQKTNNEKHFFIFHFLKRHLIFLMFTWYHLKIYNSLDTNFVIGLLV